MASRLRTSPVHRAFPRTRLPLVGLGIAAALCLGLAPPRPLDFDAQHAADAGQNPADVHFHLSFAGGRTQFHRGEIIQVEYSLASDTTDRYRSGDLWFDLSERSRFETFVCDRPADSPDPLAGHWTIWEALYNVHVTRHGGSRTALSQKPVVETLDLNDYIRFDKPGRYRLYAITRRVQTDFSPNRNPFAGGPPLASGILEVEILPDDPDWEAQQLQRAVETMILAQKNERERRNAARTIRFLQTPQALAAMVSHYTGEMRDVDAQMLSGMIGFHERAAAVKAMEERLPAADFGVSRFFLFSLGVMKLRLVSPELSASDLTDKATIKRWRHALFDVLMPYYAQLIPAAEKKDSRARALTVDTLFHTSALESFDFEKLPISPSQIDVLRFRELAILPDLPPYEQFDRVANFGWARDLPAEQVLPVLRRIYAKPAGDMPGNIQQTRNHVLKDVNRISPEEGQRLLATAIAEPHAELGARDVSNLQLTPSPELDNLLITKLEGRFTEEMKSVSPLIGQYATPAILERVRAVYEVENEAWPCDIEAGLLAYFLRVDAAYGEKIFPAADRFAASRQQITCQRATLLGRISMFYYGPFIEQSAIAQLQESDRARTIDAIEILRRHPSSAGQAALLARFERFREQWKDFDPQKSGTEIKQKWTAGNQAGLEMSLVRALSQSVEYRRHADRLEELARLCVTDECRAEAARMLR